MVKGEIRKKIDCLWVFLDGISEIHKRGMAGEATHDLHGQDFVVLRFWLGEVFCPGVTQSGPCESLSVPICTSLGFCCTAGWGWV